MENTIEVQKCKKGATYFLTGAWYECYNKEVKFKGQDKDDKFYIFVDDKKNEYSAMKGVHKPIIYPNSTSRHTLKIPTNTYS